MCGIAGIMHKRARDGKLSPIGKELISMLDALSHRGEDSTGVTVAGTKEGSNIVLRLRSSNGMTAEKLLLEAEQHVTECGATVTSKSTTGEYIRIAVNYKDDLHELAQTLLEAEGLEIHSIGMNSEVIKDVGTARDLDNKHHISELKGTHGIGHVRLATESQVDIVHSHPFWAYPFPDITVVHNGQLTNYHSLKRRYQDQGFQFQTYNDSEVIAVYLADRLARGATLEEALKASLEDLDGTFTYLVSTSQGIGCAKDRWAAKPLVAMETADVVAIASEEIALRTVFSEEIDSYEPQENLVMTWSV